MLDLWQKHAGLFSTAISSRGACTADEIARRILPEAGEPIAVPTPPAKVRTVPVVEVPRGPTPHERVARLERELDDVREDNEDLREEVRRLNDALRQAKEEIKTLREGMDEPGVLATQVPGIPWALANPRGHPIELADHFADQLQSVARDGSLAAEVHRKMEAVLEAPETYGKDMRGARKGQRACYVANNYRLVWSVSGRTVRFVLVVSKEDPEYSPFGA